MARGEEQTGPATAGEPAAAASWPPIQVLMIAVVFAVLCVTLYRPALEGSFLSDDYGYIVTNAYTSELSWDNVLAILDPTGPAKLYTANYAPVHLLLHALEQHIFADEVLGYHLVNILVHAANSALLVALLLASGVPAVGALLGGLVFAVHPANVEAVAWISQLKTNGALALSLGALLAHRRRPGLGALLFALALLTKASAVCALPAAAAFTWARRGRPGGSARHWRWLGLWGLILVLYSIPQFASFAHLGQVDVVAYDDPLVHARTIAAVGMRYLVMALTSYGVSAFQEPPPALSWLDPWWLAALPTGALLAWRVVATLRSRSQEAAYWVFAASSFALVSQLFPFVHPVADRYLYFVLPGLIGGALLLGMEGKHRLAASRESGRSLRLPSPGALAGGAAVVALLLATFFGLRTWERARLWRNETWLLTDAAAHYPGGSTAHFLRARRSAQVGDVDTAVAELRAAAELGIDSFSQIMGDPGLAPIRQTTAFAEVVREVAGRWIERARERGYSTQPELRVMGHAHLVREEYAEAVEALERALQAGGPLDSVVRAELEAVRARAAALNPGGS
jgi:hypothetical protein